MKDALETPDATTEQALGSLDGLRCLADRFPPRLLAGHMMQIFGIKSSRFYALLQAGKFDRFEMRPVIGRRAWSRELVQRYLDGDKVGSSRFVKSA